MRAVIVLAAMLVAVAGCRRQPPSKDYELQGQILAIDTQRNEVLIKHQDIKGFMPGMTMPFKVSEPGMLSGKEPGDLVTATLVVSDLEAHLSALTRTGHAPLETPPVVSDQPRPLAPGEQVPDALLIDQDGMPRPFSRFRGHRVALTFIYTRCPLPEFCPLMDRHFAAVQNTIKSTPALSDVQLVTATLDPEYDTAAVLKRHGQQVKADPAVWTMVTGDAKEVQRFALQFGIYTEKDAGSGANLIHNLRTAVIDPDGRLVTVHSGNDWTPAELVADLKAAPAPTH
jgi:protein SCO1